MHKVIVIPVDDGKPWERSFDTIAEAIAYQEEMVFKFGHDAEVES